MTKSSACELLQQVLSLLPASMAGGIDQTSRIVRAHKRVISDQQRRREVALERQKQARWDFQQRARHIASFQVSAESEEHVALVEQDVDESEHKSVLRRDGVDGTAGEENSSHHNLGFSEAARLHGAEAKQWWSQQFMLPEWMIDIPPHLKQDWYVVARPAGKRCLVVSANGRTVSRLRNGRILHSFPSALPNGARNVDVSAPSHVFCILDCVFYEPDETYYILDMMCWRGYAFYDCTVDFRFFWMSSKLEETGACDPPTSCHRFRFKQVPVFECDSAGLQAAYAGILPFKREGLVFYNRHAQYALGLTPLALSWKDANCCQYLYDTDSNGNIPSQQQVVLELQHDGTVTTGDEPPVVIASLPKEFLDQNARFLRPGMFLRFAIGDEGLSVIDGKPWAAHISYLGPASRQRPYADSCTKIMFQYAARRAPLTFHDLLAAVESSDAEGGTEMA